MSYTISVEDLTFLVQIIPTKILFAIIIELDPDNRESAGSIDELHLQMLYSMACQEFMLRQIEPLWRKAKRVAIRNAANIAKIGKIAACLGLGILLGTSLDE